MSNAYKDYIHFAREKSAISRNTVLQKIKNKFHKPLIKFKNNTPKALLQAALIAVRIPATSTLTNLALDYYRKHNINSHLKEINLHHKSDDIANEIKYEDCKWISKKAGTLAHKIETNVSYLEYMCEMAMSAMIAAEKKDCQDKKSNMRAAIYIAEVEHYTGKIAELSAKTIHLLDIIGIYSQNLFEEINKESRDFAERIDIANRGFQTELIPNENAKINTPNQYGLNIKPSSLSKDKVLRHFESSIQNNNESLKDIFQRTIEEEAITDN